MLSALKRLYERVWRPTAGRPYTYVIREWTWRHPRWGLVIVGAVVAGFVTGQMELAWHFGWKALPFLLFANFMFFTAGHLFWSTYGAYVQYIKDFRKTK